MAESRKEEKGATIDEAAADSLDASRTIEALSGLAASRTDCDSLIDRVNGLLGRRCSAKANVLPHAGDHVHTGCKCTGGDARFMADLIVLIDCSGSMRPHAKLVSDAAAAAVEAAKAKCDVDLRIAYMGVEGTWAGTVFTTDHLAYLKALWTPDPAFATDNPPRTDWHANREEGANAVEDLSKYYDWRPDTCRAIFYISDEDLDSWESTPAEDTAAVNSAVVAAKANDVTVFAHLIPSRSTTPKTQQDYKDLTTQTGGTAYINAAPSVAEYEKMLAEAICASCGRPRCRAVKAPNLEPCISVSWGDSKCDCFETDDTEIVCVTVCNCYSNISFSNFRIAGLFVTMLDGSAVPLLPDGTPSVQIVPMGPVCFGDIPPCRDDQAGCISREFVVRTRGARGGKYQLQLIGICYDVCFHSNNRDSFVLTLCSD
jgi:hypothetical protein